MTTRSRPAAQLALYVALGVVFGVVVTKSEVISWFRIQEMFRFQAFHMYGIIGSAVLVAGISLQLIKRLGAHSLDGEVIEGRGIIDESMISGEPIPVEKEIGDKVTGATVNGNLFAGPYP